MCLKMNSPATNRVGNGGCPGPARQTGANRPARKPQSISAASRTSGWRRLMISRAGRNKSSWRSSRGWLLAVPLTANHAVEGITNRPNPESRNARKQQPTTGFLAKSNTSQVKPRRWINRFRILHGRPSRAPARANASMAIFQVPFSDFKILNQLP